ncbi:MAG: hypothetical protein HYU78_16130 [Rhodocyclales bacterium]|nr:hypothetical protein [Rhodocyclales bacterium]
MICGSPAMPKQVFAVLGGCGFRISPRLGEPGDDAIARAFVEQRAAPDEVPPIRAGAVP